MSNKVDKVSGKGLSTNDYTTDEKNKLAGIAAGAEVNVQSDWNATSGDALILNKPTIPAAAANGTYTVKTLVGSTTTNVSDFTANQSSADDITFVQGSNVTITPDATNRKITIAATDTKYTAATAAPGKVATNSASGTSTNYARQDHTHGIDLATGDSNGQVKIAGTNVSVKGLGTAAYRAEGYFAGSGHTHTNMVTGSSLTANDIMVGNGSSAIKASGKSFETTLSTTSDTKIPTSKAIATYVTSQMTSVLTYKGTVNQNSDLPASHKVGDVWVVASANTYAGKACEVGDYIICKAAGTAASDADWDVINGENQVDNKSASLAAAGSSATLATVDGTNITVTTPSTWTGVAKTGTVTKVSTGAGLKGGDITSTGTVKCALSSETKSTLAATAMGSTASRQYAVGLDANGVLSVNVPWTDHTYTVNNGTFTVSGNGASVASTSANASANAGVNIKAGNNVTITTGTSEITIAAKDTTYGVVSTSANGLAPKVTDTSKFLKGDGTWATPTDTNYYATGLTVATATTANTLTISGTNSAVKGSGVISAATTTAAGLMSAEDKTKLNGIAAGAEVNVQSDWNATSGDALILNKPTIPAAVAVKGNAETNYRTGNVNITPANIGLGNVNNTADANKSVASAAKLTNTTAIGSATQPVFFTANGVPSACTYTLGKSVPSDAVFTDNNTTYTAGSFITITGSNNSINVSTGTSSTTVARGDHNHSGVYQPVGNYLTAITSSDVTTALGYTPTNVHYSVVNVTSNLTNQTCPVTLTTDGEQCNVLYVNNSTQHTVSISTNYKSPDNSQITLTIKANGYAEVNYLYYGNTTYVRGV